MEAFDSGHNTGYTYSIGFLDSAGTRVYDYNPSNSNIPTKKYQLGYNEELIGVYGVKDKKSWFTSFGFIVKVNT